jgi:NAD(P)-dependent dehydrogenase (short-subunit alcohol dehydrogenase family)
VKIVVTGGSGLIGSQLVGTVREHGHEAVAASPRSGVDTRSCRRIWSRPPRSRTPSSGPPTFIGFVTNIADAATDGTTVRLAPVLIQPMSAGEVAGAVDGVVEVAGPEQFRLGSPTPPCRDSSE